mgnify:CR=1 FL=1|tara:strand:+ start:829 stop:1044 length:216 start_codon:yes stop_codon:yes gene_type:complete
MSDEYNKELGQMKQDYMTCFDTSEGKRVLEDLVSAYYHRESFTPDPYSTAYREGQRSVIIRLINLMKETKE